VRQKRGNKSKTMLGIIRRSMLTRDAGAARTARLVPRLMASCRRSSSCGNPQQRTSLSCDFVFDILAVLGTPSHEECCGALLVHMITCWFRRYPDTAGPLSCTLTLTYVRGACGRLRLCAPSARALRVRRRRGRAQGAVAQVAQQRGLAGAAHDIHAIVRRHEHGARGPHAGAPAILPGAACTACPSLQWPAVACHAVPDSALRPVCTWCVLSRMLVQSGVPAA